MVMVVWQEEPKVAKLLNWREFGPLLCLEERVVAIFNYFFGNATINTSHSASALDFSSDED